jgi:ParB/RepB/Spo0J family partition protein
MQHRRVDPRILVANPNNPRRSTAGEAADQQLTASIRETSGPVQPPVVRAMEDGTLMIVAGHRRVSSSVAAELSEIDVFVREAENGGDSMVAFAENVVRAGMSSVDMWRAVEAFIGEGYTEDGIATALAVPVRLIRRLRLFAKILPAMLDRMAQGDEPDEDQLRIIAAAPREEQVSVWKKHKPKKTEPASWWTVSNALRKKRINALDAQFDDAYAQAHGVVWTEDLFAEGDKDPRYTEQVEAFVAAQTAWMVDHLPDNGEVLEMNQYGEVKLPPKAERAFGSDTKRKDVRLGFYLDRYSYEIKQIPFLYPTQARVSPSDGTGQAPVAKAARPDVSGKGQELIGTYRTQALQEGEISDEHLLGMLILALDGKNISVQQDYRDYRTGTDRGRYARAVAEGGVLTTDLPTLRSAARGMLCSVLSCLVNANGSGDVARIAGASIHAEAFLPNMATDEFLPKLSKDGITKVLQAEHLLPRNTGKQMRAALTEHVGEGSWAHPEALFDLTEAERTALDKRIAQDRAGNDAPDEDDPDAEQCDEDLEAQADDAGEDGDGSDAEAGEGFVPPATGRPEQRLAA